MILWCDGSHDPAENMRRDSGLLEAAGADASFEAVLRLFHFEPHGITLGYSQVAAQEIDLDRLRRDGVPWAVRPTGGRAIFHAQEWTYSLAARIDDPRWGGSLAAAYDAISKVLVGGLNRLGVPARHAPGSLRRLPGREAADRAAGAGGERDPAREPRTSGEAGHAAAACFASTSRHEVVLDGRKLVGSAQRRTTRALLQQGSLLLGTGHLKLVDYLLLDDATRDAERMRLAAASTDASRYLGAGVDLEHWADALTDELGAPVTRVDGERGLALARDRAAGGPDEPSRGEPGPVPRG